MSINVKNEPLLVFIDGEQTGTPNSVLATHRWTWVYAHGAFERDFCFDIVLFNKEKPTAEGYYIATAENNKTVLVNLVADEYGTIHGMCCYVDDIDAIKYVNNPQYWM